MRGMEMDGLDDGGSRMAEPARNVQDSMAVCSVCSASHAFTLNKVIAEHCWQGVMLGQVTLPT